MNERYRSELSELLDGEMDGASLGACLHRLAGDSEHRSRFDRYVMARECLRGNPPIATSPGFCERVLAALEDEPTVLAPAAAPPSRGDSRMGRLLRPAAGFAIAASVATVAVLGLRQDGVPEGSAPEQFAGTQESGTGRDSRGSGTPQESTASASQLQYVDARVRTPLAQPASAADREWLNTYLLRHNEAIGAAGRGGFIPYVHIVTRDVNAAGGRSVPVASGDSQPE